MSRELDKVLDEYIKHLDFVNAYIDWAGKQTSGELPLNSMVNFIELPNMINLGGNNHDTSN